MNSRNINVSTSGEPLRRNSQWQLDTTTSPESSELDISNKNYLPTGFDLYVVQKIVLELLTRCIFKDFTKLLPLSFSWFICSSAPFISDKDGTTIARCISSYYFFSNKDGSGGVNISCLTLDQFMARPKNISLITYDNYFYDPATKEYIQISHFFNVWLNYVAVTETYGLNWTHITYNIIWISSSLLINQIFKRSIWKILHVAHWMLAIFFACVLLYLCYFAAVNVNLSKVTLKSSPILERQMDSDLEFLTESMTAPPVLHILTSRSKDEVKLSTDNALILASNTIFYLFRSYVLDKLLRYCVYIANAQWQLVYRDTNVFFLWPIFFSSIGLDSVLTIPFSILVFVVDYFTFVITHHFLIEVIICEWQFFKRWQAALVLIVLANLHSERWYQIISWLIFYAIRAASCTELLIITFLYPLSRLLEDITFHNGIAASFVTVLSLRLAFLFYFINFIHWNSLSIYITLPMTYKNVIVIVLLIIMLVALLIKFYDIVITNKKVWKLIFVPIVDWGPFDVTLRLLRKKFDASKYIASQAPRELSRYLIQKAEPKSYKLDIRYDLQRKSLLYLRSVDDSKIRTKSNYLNY